MNIAEKARELVPLLRKGLNGVNFPEARPECEGDWTADYAILDRVYWEEDGHYFDEGEFEHDFVELLKSHFSSPGETVVYFSGGPVEEHKPPAGAVVIRFYRKSQEVEVYRFKAAK